MSITSTPMHDFQRSLDVAQVDADLNAQLIKYLQSHALVPVNKSELVSATCDIANVALREARALYVQNPERLVCVIAASEKSNAYAIWSSTKYDWVVLTEGLLTELRDSADDAACRIDERMPEILQSALGQRIITLPPLRGGFQTALGSLLYVAAIGFFVGHEVGHHIEGHDGYYAEGAPAEVASDSSSEVGADALIKQALEFQADRHGVLISRVVLMRFLLKLVDVANYSEREQRQYNRVIALLLSAGVLMSLVIIRPRGIDWIRIGKATHPPTVLRALEISAELTASIKANFNKLTEAERRWIRLLSLELAAQGTIVSGSYEDKMFQERRKRNEPAALRAVGLRAALYDPHVQTYIEKVAISLDPVKPRLHPRRKI